MLALATAAASPSLARSWRDLRLREATVRVAAALRRGRVAALAAGRPWQVVVTASGEIRSEPVAGASVGGPAGGSAGGSAGGPAGALTGGSTGGSTGSSTESPARPEPLPATLERLPDGVRLAAATSGGSVRFSPLGTAENATFTLESQGGQRRVIVNQRGRITCE